MAALRLGISPSLFNFVTGSILIETSINGGPLKKHNIGLGLKFNKTEEELPGYTKKIKDVWLYSSKTIDLVAEYLRRFPQVAEALSNSSFLNNRFFTLEQIFPGPDGPAKMEEMVTWVKQLEHHKIGKVKSGSDLLEANIVKDLERILDSFRKWVTVKNMQVKPQFLFKSDLVFGNLPPVKFVRHKLLDRVVSVRSSYTVPVGARGYIIGIHKAPVEADYTYDILFDEPFVGGMTINSSPQRAFRMLASSFLNVSDANRVSQVKTSGKPIPNLTPVFKAPHIAPESPNAHTKPSAFVQWNNRPPRKADDERFKEMWSILQNPKPAEESTDVLKKILKIDSKEKPAVEDPVKSFFDQVAQISCPEKTEPARAHPVTVPQNQNTYSVRLMSYFQRRNLGQPRFNFLHSGGKVTAQVYFHDRRIYSGIPCDDKFSACERSAFQVLSALGEISPEDEASSTENRQKVLENQSKLLKSLWNEPPADQHRFPPQNFCRNGAAGTNNLPRFLPRPPSQWVGSPRNAAFQYPRRNHDPSGPSHFAPTKGHGEKSQETPVSSGQKPPGSALKFVPLQAIAGKRSTRGNVVTVQQTRPSPNKTKQKKVEVTSNVNNLLGPPKSARKPRRPKIAASLAFDPNLY